MEWAVRDEKRARHTGFSSREDIARKVFEGLLEKARQSGEGGEYSLLCNGKVVASVTVAGRE
jgi:hypothetical protein